MSIVALPSFMRESTKSCSLCQRSDPRAVLRSGSPHHEHCCQGVDEVLELHDACRGVGRALDCSELGMDFARAAHSVSTTAQRRKNTSHTGCS